LHSADIPHLYHLPSSVPPYNQDLLYLLGQATSETESDYLTIERITLRFPGMPQEFDLEGIEGLVLKPMSRFDFPFQVWPSASNAYSIDMLEDLRNDRSIIGHGLGAQKTHALL